MRTLKTRDIYRTRERRIEFLKRRLVRKSYPRLHASFILLLTGLAGFLASFGLLHLGMSSMWLRYPLAILFAYCVFLILLRLWLSLIPRTSHDLDVDVVETTIDVASEFTYGGGGSSSEESVSAVTSTNSLSTVTSTNSSGSTGFSFDLDLEEAWLIVIAIAALIGGLIATFYVVYIAPALLAEVLLDGMLMAGLYKRVKSIEHRHWLSSALRQTAVAVIVVVVFFTLAGFAMQKVAPAARSIGEVWEYIVER
jgi:hypothetical protein